MIQHDCGHGTLFTKRGINDWVGRFLGVLTLTPCDYWRKSHAHHHASSSNLARHGIGDIKLLKVREYAAWGHGNASDIAFIDTVGEHSRTDHDHGSIHGVWLFYVQHQFEDTFGPPTRLVARSLT